MRETSYILVIAIYSTSSGNRLKSEHSKCHEVGSQTRFPGAGCPPVNSRERGFGRHPLFPGGFCELETHRLQTWRGLHRKSAWQRFRYSYTPFAHHLAGRNGKWLKSCFQLLPILLLKKILSLHFSDKSSEQMNLPPCQGTPNAKSGVGFLVNLGPPCALPLQAYYAIFLNKGRLEVHLSTGARIMRKIVVRPEPSLFHDGREHSVHVERTRG